MVVEDQKSSSNSARCYVMAYNQQSQSPGTKRKYDEAWRGTDERQSILDISLCKLDCSKPVPRQVSRRIRAAEPELRRSVLIYNTLRHIERELRREGVPFPPAANWAHPPDAQDPLDMPPPPTIDAYRVPQWTPMTTSPGPCQVNSAGYPTCSSAGSHECSIANNPMGSLAGSPMGSPSGNPVSKPQQMEALCSMPDMHSVPQTYCSQTYSSNTYNTHAHTYSSAAHTYTTPAQSYTFPYSSALESCRTTEPYNTAVCRKTEPYSSAAVTTTEPYSCASFTTTDPYSSAGQAYSTAHCYCSTTGLPVTYSSEVHTSNQSYSPVSEHHTYCSTADQQSTTCSYSSAYQTYSSAQELDRTTPTFSSGLQTSCQTYSSSSEPQRSPVSYSSDVPMTTCDTAHVAATASQVLLNVDRVSVGGFCSLLECDRPPAPRQDMPAPPARPPSPPTFTTLTPLSSSSLLSATVTTEPTSLSDLDLSVYDFDLMSSLCPSLKVAPISAEELMHSVPVEPLASRASCNFRSEDIDHIMQVLVNI